MSRKITLISLNPNDDSFVFRFLPPNGDPIAFDFRDGESIILHLSIRPDDHLIVINDLLAGEWGSEIRIPNLKLSAGLPVHLGLTTKAGEMTLTVNAEPVFSGRWRGDLGLAKEITLGDLEVSVMRGTIGAVIAPQMDLAMGEQNRATVSDRIDHMKAHALRAVSIALDASINSIGALVAQEMLTPHEERYPGPAIIEFTNREKVKAHKSCELKNGRLVCYEPASTPGAKIIISPPQRLSAIDIRGISSDTNTVNIQLQSRDNIVFTGGYRPSRIGSTYVSNVVSKEPIDTVFVTMSQPATGDSLKFDKITIFPYTPDVLSLRRPGQGTIAAGVASTPDRVDALLDAINSLVSQVDELHVFLNGYEEIPALPYDKISRLNVYISDDHDILGDAGKFFGIDKTSCDFYFTFDDDILYPGDYVEKLIDASSRLDAPVGVHGSLLKFPFGRYYDDKSRYVFHFRDSCEVDRRVHVLGTGTLCIPRKYFPSPAHFNFPNMADIWFAKFCADRDIPQYAIRRPYDWLKPIEGLGSSIFDQNSGVLSSQHRLVEYELGAVLGKLARGRASRPRVLIAVKTYNRRNYLAECLASLVKTVCDDRFDISIAVADDGSTDETLEYLRDLNIPFETHLILNDRRYTPGQFNDILDLFASLKADFLFVLDDDVVFKKPGWCSLYYDAAMESGYHHLCHYNLPHAAQLFARKKEPFPPPAMAHNQFPLTAYGNVERCMGALFTVSQEMMETVGYADEVNFFIRGLWHIDYSSRACRAGFNESCRFFDVANSNSYIELQNTLKGAYTPAISWGSDDFKRISTPVEIARRWSIVRIPDRAFISAEDAKSGRPAKTVVRAPPLISVNDVFDRVFVINLDRRKDRMTKMRRRLKNLKIRFERVSAIDGSSVETQAAYAKYVERNGGQADRYAGMTSEAFFFNYPSDRARAEHLKLRFGGPPLRSAGALAYLRTYRNILLKALDEGAKRVLVFDDDCLFHTDFASLFSEAYRQLPKSWKILQLGTMQYDWHWTSPYSKNLYLPNGVVVGSHAVGIDVDIIPDLIRTIEYWTLPFDMGPLHYVARKYRDASFVITPNLAIQDQSESDIRSSDVAEAEALKSDNVYKWAIADYVA